MEKCHICKDGTLIRTASSKGPEIYCGGCRRIILSSMFSLNFTASVAEQEIEPCIIDSMPGWKGPGKNAQCHPYEEGNEISQAAAKKDAIASWYSYKHRKGASKIVNALSFFDGKLPAVTDTDKPNPSVPQKAATPPQTGIGEATAPGGIQPGDLNAANPLNTANKRIAELAHELSMEYMGPAMCTEHNSTECGCNHNRNSQ